MEQPEVTLTATHVDLDLIYEVTGAPPLTRRYAQTITFQPTSLRVSYRDDRFVRAVISGPRILKSGHVGHNESETFYGRHDGLLPAWAAPYCAEENGQGYVE